MQANLRRNKGLQQYQVLRSEQNTEPIQKPREPTIRSVLKEKRKGLDNLILLREVKKTDRSSPVQRPQVNSAIRVWKYNRNNFFVGFLGGQRVIEERNSLVSNIGFFSYM